jgi:hypothetical protein
VHNDSNKCQLCILIAIVDHYELKVALRFCSGGKLIFSDMKCAGNLDILLFSFFSLF